MQTKYRYFVRRIGSGEVKKLDSSVALIILSKPISLKLYNSQSLQKELTLMFASAMVSLCGKFKAENQF